jgi:hypothetical protein
MAQTDGLMTGFYNKQVSVPVSERKIELSVDHIKAVNRSRRIVLQYDAFFDLGTDFNKWISKIFGSVDKPGSQIDALWWDIGGANMAPYPERVGDRYEHPGLKKWWDQGIDWIAELVKESRKRNLEVFWNHRIAEVDRDATGFPLGGGNNPLKKAHPEWLVKSWYYSGLWNLAVPEVRTYKVEFIQELLEKYEFDGIQLDFARHIPCLPVGHQWELRENVTEFVRMVRIMMLDMERKLGRPLLLSAKVPEKLEGCRVDGFDVEVWAQQNLVDIFILGSRSIDVDVAAYRRITKGHNIKLIPCWDDHHSSDAYRSPDIEIHRGIFGNWWQQGADGIMIFNWFVDGEKGYNRDRLLTVAREAGTPETLYLKDKTFVTERRGGYPWAEGYFNRNELAPLPLMLSNDGRPAIINIRICDNIKALNDKINRVTLRAVIFGAKEGDEIGARLNGVALPTSLQDHSWKDNQIFSPNPQPNSGSGLPPDNQIDPKQKLFRLEFEVDPGLCHIDENQFDIYIIKRVPYGHGSTIHNIVLEKLELLTDYK